MKDDSGGLIAARAAAMIILVRELLSGTFSGVYNEILATPI